MMPRAPSLWAWLLVLPWLGLAPRAAAGEEHAHDHRFEVGLSAGMTYVVKEQEPAANVHVHALVAIPGTIAELGLGYERLFDEHAHNTVGLVLACRVTERFSLTFSPGLSFRDEAPGDLAFSMHMETTYELWAWDYLHLGPALEVAVDPDGLHLTAAVHVGLAF